jgi:hypothetical protein
MQILCARGKGGACHHSCQLHHSTPLRPHQHLFRTAALYNFSQLTQPNQRPLGPTSLLSLPSCLAGTGHHL